MGGQGSWPNVPAKVGRTQLGPAKVFRHLAAIALLVTGASAMPVVSAPGTSSDSAVVPTAEALYKKGKTSFRKRCARCHGVNMVNPGVGVFDLRTFPHDDKARFVDSVSNGKNAMPSWGEVLKPADIDMLWVYVTGPPS
jgi:mono/diheme cytochrome c family protein